MGRRRDESRLYMKLGKIFYISVVGGVLPCAWGRGNTPLVVFA